MLRVQPHVGRAAPDVQRSLVCAMQMCTFNAAPQARRSPTCATLACRTLQPYLATGSTIAKPPGQQGTRSPLKSAMPPPAGSPLLHAAALLLPSEVARASTASGRRAMGQLTRTVQPAFGTHSKCSIFHLHTPHHPPPPEHHLPPFLFLFLWKNFRHDLSPVPREGEKGASLLVKARQREHREEFNFLSANAWGQQACWIGPSLYRQGGCIGCPQPHERCQCRQSG